MNWYRKIANKQDNLISLFSEKWKELGVTSFLFDKGSTIYLGELIVEKSFRQQGIGTRFMTELIAIADHLRKRIILTPSKSYGATSVARLENFYKRFGFVKNKGNNKDHTVSETMYRDPK